MIIIARGIISLHPLLWHHHIVIEFKHAFQLLPPRCSDAFGNHLVIVQIVFAPTSVQRPYYSLPCNVPDCYTGLVYELSFISILIPMTITPILLNNRVRVCTSTYMCELRDPIVILDPGQLLVAY